MESMESTATPQTPATESTPPTAEIPPSSNPTPNQNPSSQPIATNSLQRPPPPSLNRSRPQLTHYQHFSQHLHPTPPLFSSPSNASNASSSSSSSSFSASASSSLSTPRGALAVAVPANNPRPQQSFSSFGSSSFNSHYSGIASSNPQARPHIQGQGIQTVGMMGGSLGSGSQMRPSVVTGHHQQRPGQPPLRPQSPSNNPALTTQKFQGHNMLRVPSMGSPSTSSPGMLQGSQPHQQPWISSQGKSMHASSLTSPTYRPQMKPQTLQQKSQYGQPHPNSLLTPSHQQQTPSAQQPQQLLPSHQQPQEHYGQQYQPPRTQQQVTRAHGSANQKSHTPATLQTGLVQSGPLTPVGCTEAAESGNQILGKRSIRELVTQIDPSERIDPEVEDILVEIAEDFIESITTFGCSLAKHRKSPTLEAKDILLHLERNWNMTLPGFSGDEIKIYKKPFANEIHKERLAVIKRSAVGTESGNVKNSVGQAAGNAKSHATKTPAMNSPRTRELS